MLSWLPEPNVWTNDAWTPNIMDSYLNCFEGWGSVFDIDKILCIGQIRPYNVVSVVTVERMNTSGHQIATSLTNKPRVQDWCWLTQSYSHLVNHLKVKEGYTTYKQDGQVERVYSMYYIQYPFSIQHATHNQHNCRAERIFTNNEKTLYLSHVVVNTAQHIYLYF